jgi:hypothetical protein
MIKRIVVLFKVLSKMSDSLYMLRCSSRSYLVRYTVILVTSRDCNHITWSRNSASVSLLATLSHRTWVANDFSSSQLFQKRSKLSDCTFWSFSYKRKFSFLLIFCTRNRHSTVIEDYIRRDDVIWCELNRFNFHWNRDLIRTWSFNSHWNRI